MKALYTADEEKKGWKKKIEQRQQTLLALFCIRKKCIFCWKKMVWRYLFYVITFAL